MTLSQIYRKIKARLPLSLQFLFEVLSYWKRLCKYNASMATDKDIRKMQYTLLRENHVIEKGMSMCNTRRGYGQVKVNTLINRLRRYSVLYGSDDKDFLQYPLSTIKAYIDYQRNDHVDIPEIESNFMLLCKDLGVDRDNLSTPAGIEVLKADQLKSMAKEDFSSLLYSRHSIRYFKNQQPSVDLIEKALTLASRTPSACNRQAWHTHIFFGEDTHEMLRMQGGCNGFCDDIHCCIVVTADMKGFLGHEPFQCYIDGGLYAQNLINALHYRKSCDMKG